MTNLTEALRDQLLLTAPVGADDALTTLGSDPLDRYKDQVYFQKGESSQGFRKSMWIWNAVTEAWDCFPMTAIHGIANPVGVVTPDAIGQRFYNTVTKLSYEATGTSASDWSPA